MCIGRRGRRALLLAGLAALMLAAVGVQDAWADGNEGNEAPVTIVVASCGQLDVVVAHTGTYSYSVGSAISGTFTTTERNENVTVGGIYSSGLTTITIKRASRVVAQTKWLFVECSAPPRGATGPQGPTGPQGATGSQGPGGTTGATGPSSLAALKGSPCTFAGNPSSLAVAIDSTTGAVGLTCTPVYTVSATISGGTMSFVNLRDETAAQNNQFHPVSGSVSTLMPSGHEAVVLLDSGDIALGGGQPFNYTCPGKGNTAADPQPALNGGTYYQAACTDPSLSGDYAVTVTFG